MTMTRKEIIEELKEIGNITLNSNQVEDILPEVHFYLEEEFKFFLADPNNKTTEKDLEDFEKGKFLVDICFLDDKVTYTVGRDTQQLSNEPNWAEDDYNDIETERLAALLEFAKQS